MAANPFWKDGVRKQIVITYDEDKTITNTELYSEAFELTERLCSSDNLRFGSCESSVVKFRIANTFEQLKDKDIDIGMHLENEEGKYPIGKYKVFSDTPSANRKYRDVVAYDAMATIIGLNVIDWYNGIFEENEELTLKEFRDSFFEYVGVTQKPTILPNDDMIVKKTLDQKELTGGKVAYCICEINGCFGHINRDGLFEYVFLTEIGDAIFPSHVLYPSKSLFPQPGIQTITDILYPSDSLYPSDDEYPTPDKGIWSIESSYYISAEYKDYYVKKINRLQIRLEENNIGCEYGSGDNVYLIEDNFLVFGKETDELYEIAKNTYKIISAIWYTPAHVLLKGNLDFSVGDAIKIIANPKNICTYILERTLSGIQSLKDNFYAEGLEKQPEVEDTLERSMIELKGQSKSIEKSVAVVAEKIEADRARIGYIEANYVQTSTLIANYATIANLNVVNGKIDNLAAIAITTQNLSAQTIYGRQISGLTINANQITAGTIDTDRLDADTIRTKYLNACAVSPHQGQMDIGTVRLSELWVYDGSTNTYHRVY